MKSDALINEEVRILSDEEKQAEEKFHLSRIPFIWIPCEDFPYMKLVFNENLHDDRDHQHWVLEDYNIEPWQFEHLPRSYIRDGRIQFFQGSSFQPIGKQLNTTLFDFFTIAEKYQEQTDWTMSDVIICNGVRIGKIGEVWDPIEIIGVISF